MSSKLIWQIGRWVLTPAWHPNKLALCSGALSVLYVEADIRLSPNLLLSFEIDALLMLQTIACDKV